MKGKIIIKSKNEYGEVNISAPLLSFEEKKDFNILSYETEEDKLVTTTSLRFNDRLLHMHQSGAINHKIIYKEGYKHKSLYKTFVGEMEFITLTSKYSYQKNDKVYNILIEAKMYQGDVLVTSNHIDMKIILE